MDLTPALLAELTERSDEPVYYLQVHESDVEELAAGIVPRTVMAMCEYALHFHDRLEANARRPIRKKKA